MTLPNPPPLFPRLFRFRQTGARTPTEDFLSEALVGFLDLAPASEALQFVLDCFVPALLVMQFRELAALQRLTFTTQVALPDRKILDILVKLGSKPVLLIENKVSAPFQKHAKAGNVGKGADEMVSSRAIDDAVKTSSDEQTVHQLQTYSSWLRSQERPSGWPGIVTVLTHTTFVPPDVLTEIHDRLGVESHICYWRNVHGWLRKRVGNKNDDPLMPAWEFVGHELCRFLESRAMNTSDLTSVDISAINVSMNSLRTFESCFAEINQRVLATYPTHLVRKAQDWLAEWENSRTWGYTYFSGVGAIWIGYGIFYSPLVGALAGATPPLPDQEHAFITVGSDGHALSRDSFEVPDGWSLVGDGYSVIKPISLTRRVSGSPFPQFILETIEHNITEILSLRAEFVTVAQAATAGGR